MPQYMTVHRAPGILQEQWTENAVGAYRGEHASYQQAYVNLGTGFILTIYEAESQAKLEEQFEELGLPFDEIHEVQFSQSRDEMIAMLEQRGLI